MEIIECMAVRTEIIFDWKKRDLFPFRSKPRTTSKGNLTTDSMNTRPNRACAASDSIHILHVCKYALYSTLVSFEFCLVCFLYEKLTEENQQFTEFPTELQRKLVPILNLK